MNILAKNGKFVCAEQGGGINGFDRPDALIANRETAGEWETFELVKNDETISFKTSGGFYFTAEDGGGGPISTNRRRIGAWEQFTILNNIIFCSDKIHCLRVTSDDTLDARGELDDVIFEFPGTDGGDAIRPSIDRRFLEGGFCIPTKSNRVWQPAFLAVSDDEQDRYIAETIGRNYNFFEILVSGKPYGNDYPEILPDAGLLREGLEKIKYHGLTTIVAFDDSRGDDLSYLSSILEPSHGLIDWCMGIYEINGVLKDPNKTLNVLKQSRQLLPNCLLAVHFEPLDAGRESYGLVDWQKAKDEAGLNALFFQTAGWEVGIDDAATRLQDFTRRLMGGYHGYPVLSHGVYDFENSTSKTYRYEWTEQQGIQFTNDMMNYPLLPEEDGFMAIKPTGFCDGGTPVHV